jgi:hypothetical protein
VVVGDAEVDVGAGGDVDGLDGGDDVEVDGAREVVDDDSPPVAPPAPSVIPSVGWAAATPGPAEVVGWDEVAVVPANDARTSATVDVGETTGTCRPPAGGCTAGPESPAGAGSPDPGSAELCGERDGEPGAESSARAAGGATHGRRSPGRTGPPRRPTARTAT